MLVGNNNTGNMVSIMGNVKCLLHSINYGCSHKKIIDLFNNLLSDFNGYVSKIVFEANEMSITVYYDKSYDKIINLTDRLYETYRTLLINNEISIMNNFNTIYGIDASNIYDFVVNKGGYTCLCSLRYYGDGKLKMYM